jgi:hypothetical protein
MKSNWFAASIVSLIASITFGADGKTVHFEINADKDIKPISPYVYGINQFRGVVDGMEGPYSNLPFVRISGNRFTAYNWTNNASNAGVDYHFETDDYLVSGPYYQGMADLPGGAYIPIVKEAFKRNAAVELTVPINGYVTANKTHVDDVRKDTDFLHKDFIPEQPRKNAPFSMTPDPNAKTVYQDEFVNWVKNTFSYAQTDALHPIWFSLDNEPDWWYHTHPQIHPAKITFTELMKDTLDYASAIKDVMPNTLVFGPVNYGWHGYDTLQDASDRNDRDFQEFYLAELAKAEKNAGHRLVDVLDVHYYPEAKSTTGVRIIYSVNNTPPVVAARVQATRSLWDPNYTEDSWIAKGPTHGPIRMIPRLFDKINKNYPGTKLSITEYEFGGGNHISGAIAQADALGIFGREGVFAAALWPGDNIQFQAAAFECYRNFDGKNGVFGDTSIHAVTDNLDATSIYASTDSKNPDKIVLVAINKTDAPVSAKMDLHLKIKPKKVQVYQLTAAVPKIKSASSAEIPDPTNFNYTLPPFSISTIELTN